MKFYKDVFNKIISLDNLFNAWEKFKSDKRNKRDVQLFEWHLEQNIFQLHRDLKSKIYKHEGYTSFYIHDPKQRHIHKATVRDRVLHHAVFSILNPIFEQTFIHSSFSCRIDKGTHKGIDALRVATRKVGNNGFKPCFILKCDIKKFFATVNHQILLDIIGKRIKDANAIWLLREIIGSFPNGVPIGNLTSQLFANVYLNKLDYFVKHDLRVKFYFRYTDDFVVVANNIKYLEEVFRLIKYFLETLALELHPNKITIRKLHQGIDFLGYVSFPHHSLLRTKTKKRILKKMKYGVMEYKRGSITKERLEQSLQSYLGILSHADAYDFANELKNKLWFWLSD